MIRLSISMALTNIKNNRKNFLPYIISCIMTIAIFYIVCSLAENKQLEEVWGGNIIRSYMNMGQIIVAIFSVIFLFYINSFLIKRRHSEFGLYNILGMEKRHIAKVIVFETLFSFIISVAVGLVFGMLLDKLMYLIVLKMLKATVPMGFYISGIGIFKTIMLFGVIFMLILLRSIRQVYKAKPVEMLQSSKAGEKEPKAKWVLAILGIICLLGGYGIAVFTENPVAAFLLFFVAVILVIVGTYLLFTSGSIALLKILKKNKGYYYKSRHFISVSSMMYRMKKNAVGLASICILSTMVLVMISAVVFMNVGSKDAIAKRYPAEFEINCVDGDPQFEKSVEILDKNAEAEGLPLKKAISYRTLSVSAVYEKDQDKFIADPNAYSGMSSIQAYNNLVTLQFVTLEEYNKTMNTHETLGKDEVLVYSNRKAPETDNIKVFDCNFKIKKNIDEFMKNGDAMASITITHFVVVKDEDVFKDLYEKQKEVFGEYASFIQMNYLVDPVGDREENKDTILAVNGLVNRDISAMDSFTGSMKCRSVQEENYLVDFAGLFFIGVFLGLLFVMATVLIVYYKQITEGYEDKERFEIMQNVGMSHVEVKRSINSQILIVFFLPLVTAGIHIAFAFPFIYKIMLLLGLMNMGLFAVCTAGCFLAFGGFYTIVYMMTAKLYYGIVKK